MRASNTRKFTAILCLTLFVSGCSNVTPALVEITSQAASLQETNTPAQNNAVNTSVPTDTPEASLVAATVTTEPEPTLTPLPTLQIDPVNVRLRVRSEAGQPVYLDRDTVTLTRNADGQVIGMIGRNDEFFNAVQPGDYTLKINAQGYEAFEERIAVSGSDLELTATLKIIGIAANPEDMILLGSTIFRYDTGEVLFSGPVFNLVQYVRPDRKSFLATNGLGYAIVMPDGSLPYNILTVEQDPNQATQRETPPGYSVSPDLSRALFEIASDIWVGDIDWDKGLIRNARQVTQVGAFNSSIYDNGQVVWHPDGEYVLVLDKYRINLKSGEIKTLEGGIGQVSPNGRYGLRWYPSRIYDWVADVEYPLAVDQQRGCWREDGTRVYVDKASLRLARDGQESELDMGVELKGDLGCRGNYVVGRRTDNKDNTLTFVNVESGKTFDGPKNLYDIKLTGDYAIGSVLDKSDFDVRGTYLINMKDGIFTRVSAYPTQSSSDNLGRLADLYNNMSVILPDKDTAMFVANNQLWKTDLTGSLATKLADIADPNMLYGGRMLRLQLLGEK